MNFWSSFKSYLKYVAAPNIPVGTRQKHRKQASYYSGTIAVLTVVAFTSIIGERFYNQPQLAVETIAPITVIAPADGEFEDEKTTEAKRQEIRTGSVPSLKRDLDTTRAIREDIRLLLQDITDIRELAGEFPFVAPEILSPSSQSALRQLPEDQWQTFVAIAATLDSADLPSLTTALPTDPDISPAFRELYAAVQRQPDLDLTTVMAETLGARNEYQQAIRAASNLEQPLFQAHHDQLLRLSTADWQNTETQLLTISDRILTQGIARGIADELLLDTIDVHLEANIVIRPFMQAVLAEYLQPN